MASRAPLGSFLLFGAIFLALQFPALANAQVNPECVGGWVPTCPCGQIINPKGGCMTGDNKFMCSCHESSNGFTAAGQCFAPGQCHAQSTSDSKGPDQGLSQLMQAISKMMEMLKGGGGSGSGSDPGTGASTGACLGTPYKTSIPNGDPCATYDPTAGQSTTDILNGLATLNTNNTNTDIASQLVSSLVGSVSTSDATVGSIVPDSVLATTSIIVTKDLTPGVSAATSQSVFGATPGVVGDIQVISGNRATILASNRDIAGNRQTSGFYGFNLPGSLSPNDVYIKLCAARQWAVGFLSAIVPASFYDSLCSSHGYAVGPPPLAPGVTISPTPRPAPAPKPVVVTAPPKYLGPLRADIWASPTSVTSGSRTSIFWDSAGALSCSVTSDDKAFTQSTLSGHATSPALTKNTTFSMACQSATSTASSQVVVSIH